MREETSAMNTLISANPSIVREGMRERGILSSLWKGLSSKVCGIIRRETERWSKGRKGQYVQDLGKVIS